MDDLISVIVPVYKVEKYLDRCVESITNQTYKNLEIILVDDGSPDNCPKMCDEWVQKDSRIKVIHKENGGLSDARNAGMAIATGEVISFIDSDDYIDLNMYELLINKMHETDSDIVSCGVNWVDESGGVLKCDMVLSDVVFSTEEAMKELLDDGALKQPVWNRIYKREIALTIPFEKGKCHEDVFWSYQAVGKSKRICVINHAFYYYVQRSDSIMGQSFSEKRLDALEANHYRCEYIKKNFPELYIHASYIYLGTCFYYLQCALRLNCDKKIAISIIEKKREAKIGRKYSLPIKQMIWINMFCLFPFTTCRIRNRLKIGV